MCYSFKILNLFGILSPWGSSNYRPSAPFLYDYEVASHVKNCHFGNYYYYYYYDYKMFFSHGLHSLVHITWALVYYHLSRRKRWKYMGNTKDVNVHTNFRQDGARVPRTTAPACGAVMPRNECGLTHTRSRTLIQMHIYCIGCNNIIGCVDR